MKNLKFLSMLVAGAMVLSATAAFAQRDAGAKMRGEFGTGFWSTPGVTRTYMYPVPSYIAPAPTVVRAAPGGPYCAGRAASGASSTARRAFSLSPARGDMLRLLLQPSHSAPSVRRSYSYEPTYVPSTATQWTGRRMAPQPTYLLPKTDARKFGG
jgi:hypothetical protein